MTLAQFKRFFCLTCYHSTTRKFWRDPRLPIRRHLRGVRSSGYGVKEHARFQAAMDKMCASKSSQNKVEPTNMGIYVKRVIQEPELAEIEKDHVTKENQYKLLSEVMTPLHELSYDSQLQAKYKANLNVLRQYGKILKENGGKIVAESKDMPCVLDPPIPAPVIKEYRNKDEFSIRTGVDGDPKTVGFFLDSPSDNETVCVEPHDLCIIKESHKLFAKLFQSYIHQSPLPACHNFHDGGHWRNLVVRSNNKGDIMGVVIMHPQQLSKEQIADEMQRLKEFFMQSSEWGLDIKSFYFQSCSQTRCTNAVSPFQLLFGEPYLYEEINGLKYRISPESFFQSNTSAAEKLYKTILNACKATKNTTVLDICCGVGPVSLTLSPKVKKCIGIDASEQAIADARINSEMNNINNVEFHVGRCEYVLSDILNELYAEELIAIVNPGSSSLGINAMKVLRSCKHLKKVVYASCNAKSAISNFVALSKPASTKFRVGPPFWPMRSVLVDLFPQTSHSELVVLFQR